MGVRGLKKCVICGRNLSWFEENICMDCSNLYSLSDFGIIAEKIIVWACEGMRLPNMLSFGSTVKFKRWHGNYIRCFYHINDEIYSYTAREIFITALPLDAKITAVVEFVGNTLKNKRSLIIFSEFVARNFAFWNDGTVAFNLTEGPNYHAFVEVNGSGKFLNLSQKDVFWAISVALENLNGIVKEQLRKFAENFYFFPREWEKYRNYVDIKSFDCIWI